MTRTALTDRQVDVLTSTAKLHVCNGPRGLGLAGTMHQIIEGLVILGITAEADDIVDTLTSLDGARITIDSGTWSIEFPHLTLPEGRSH